MAIFNSYVRHNQRVNRLMIWGAQNQQTLVSLMGPQGCIQNLHDRTVTL